MISPLERQNMSQHLETRWRSKRTLNPSPLMRTLKSQLISEQALTKNKKKKKDCNLPKNIPYIQSRKNHERVGEMH